MSHSVGTRAQKKLAMLGSGTQPSDLHDAS